MKDLTRGNPTKLMLAFALPILLGNVFQLFYNLADTRIVGSLLGETALAAVGATNSLNSMLIGFANGMMNGFGIITARHFGAGNEDEVRRSVASFLVLGGVIAAGLTTAFVVGLGPLLRILNTPEHIIGMSATYFRIILLGLTASMLYNGCAALLRAIGDTVTPLLFLILSVVLNVGLDLLFVGPLGLGVAGAAGATVLSQAFSGALCLIYIAKRYQSLHPAKQHFRLDPWMVRQMLSSGFSMGFMMCLVTLGSVILQSVINTFGENVIVGHTAARRCGELFMLPFSVLGTTMATFSSQNWGAGKPERIRTGVFQSLIISAVWCALAIVIAWAFAPQLVHMITGSSNEEVIATANRYLQINSLLYYVTAVICVLRNMLQGVGDLITPIVSSALELFGKIAVVIFLTPKLGYFGIILSEPIVWCIMVIPLITQSIKHLKRRAPADA